MKLARGLAPLVSLCLAVSSIAAADEEFKFDAAEFQKKPFELGGYLELKPDHSWLNQDSAYYKLNFYARSQRDTLDQADATLKLNGKYTQGFTTINLRGSVEVKSDGLSSSRISRFDEAYVSFKPDPGFTLDAGKVALKWGKGYAWNPVGFVERPKNPNDTELPREGYTVLAADFVRNLEGDLKTIAFTPLLLPVSSQVNNDFGKPNHVNFAAKLYLLYHDTDIDFTWLASGSRTPRFGVDFSRNLTTSREFHGEWARIFNVDQRLVSPTGSTTTTRSNVTNYLLGLRYLTERDTTWILEYYRNGTGYALEQAADFYRLVNNGLGQFQTTGNDVLLQRAAAVSQGGYARANPMQRYLYLRVSQKEPFDIVYFIPSITTIVNVDDRSYTVTPELSYSGVTNLDLRLRMMWLHGEKETEFGEKQNARRLELMLRVYF